MDGRSERHLQPVFITPPRQGSIYAMSVSRECLSVCRLTYVRTYLSKIHQFFMPPVPSAGQAEALCFRVVRLCVRATAEVFSDRLE